MTLIKSISGFRGTIGGKAGQNLTPIDLVECTAAYGKWLIEKNSPLRVVVGRDARISGEMVHAIVTNTLISMGITVVDLGLSTTPTVEIAVPDQNAGGGIILTASHNPKQWNALKFLNENGEFISKESGQRILELIDTPIEFADVDHLGKIEEHEYYIDKHIEMILDLPEVQVDLVKSKSYKVVIDPINSVGTIAIPLLLNKLGVNFKLIHAEPHGDFAHNPEPLAEHLKDLSTKVLEEKADLGISVDPDVDRLAFMCEDGNLFGEEFTLVAAADYVLGIHPGPTVSNVSSTLALKKVTEDIHHQNYYSSAVGEVNVVQKMKEVNAAIGGEGNGGVIYPSLHYGRDALVGIALFLSHLAQKDCTMTELKSIYPPSHMIKDKVPVSGNQNLSEIFDRIKSAVQGTYNEIDGLKIEWPDSWVQIRPSNTEPIFRIYAEGQTPDRPKELVKLIKSQIQ